MPEKLPSRNIFKRCICWGRFANKVGSPQIQNLPCIFFQCFPHSSFSFYHLCEVLAHKVCEPCLVQIYSEDFFICEQRLKEFFCFRCVCAVSEADRSYIRAYSFQERIRA